MAVRLLKVTVQPVFVNEDEDGNLEELVAEPLVVPAKDWPTYASDQFPKLVEELQSRLS